ncbi:hypothetical protein PSCLAVI8L_480007 [Pseudoclavibacter sp. 8L]|nr:hypothetical protein PSCLAVI8L_480007 [Pseudoclavibacter sp. 8L]
MSPPTRRTPGREGASSGSFPTVLSRRVPAESTNRAHRIRGNDKPIGTRLRMQCTGMNVRLTTMLQGAQHDLARTHRLPRRPHHGNLPVHPSRVTRHLLLGRRAGCTQRRGDAGRGPGSRGRRA